MIRLIRFFFFVAFLYQPYAMADSDAKSYPNKPIKIIVSLTAGGPTDTLARIIAPPLSQQLGQPVLIDNRPGAGGNIGADLAAKSTPDGYTLYLGTSGPLSINPALYQKLSYDPFKDFSPISQIAYAPFVIVVNPATNISSISELIQLAKKNPNKLNAGSVTGSAAHLSTELFKSQAGIEMTQVPYKGAAQATNDLLAGQIDVSFASLPGVYQNIKSGNLKALSVTSAKRLPQLKDIPTVSESVINGYESSVWYGLVAPAGTPDSIILKLNKTLQLILQDKRIREQMYHNDFTPIESNPAAFAAYIKAENIKWGSIIKARNIRAE
jgi:tripartite-type tricarboxylate transporter receptor subunit TctC